VQYVEDKNDINNIEAWAEIVTDVLWRVPFDNRLKVLQLAIAKHEADVAYVAENGPWKITCAADVDMNTPGVRHWNAIMRLKSAIIQVFARDIRNNHSPADAAKMLFAVHRYGKGSRYLGDYINDLVELDRGG
jgi:hypothetical protein